MWLSIITFIVTVLALISVLFFNADNAATQRCEAKGYSAEYCGWR